ncbi:unnamed protein product [Acanthoscelides obtectus]|uniref:Uncharacterized protein n=1 Tax=Acanthoscelides obtectus TaxID=200917 RepID=A0A9P0LUH2_ACAOB|nr:unnamed protein product [Acanthoscelides obtectus]CAK1659526.1 hypothetical protein AOBTE_LOCUS21504 [Acanthoscelides obtectus]
MPTFSNSVREEVIDVTLSTLNLAQDIRDWKVSLTPSLSDHRYILFKTDGEIPDKYARNPRHTRWGSFRADIDSKLGAVPYRLGRGSDIEAAVESLSRDLTAAYEENCPLRKVQEQPPHSPEKSSAQSAIDPHALTVNTNQQHKDIIHSSEKILINVETTPKKIQIIRKVEDSDSFSSDDNIPLANFKAKKFRSPFQELFPTPNYAVTKNKPKRKAIDYKSQRITKDLFKEH